MSFIPNLTSSYATVQPVVHQSYAPVYGSYVAPQIAPQYSSQYAKPVVAPTYASQAYHSNVSNSQLRGNSRLEYVPYQRKVVDYEQQVYTQTVPKERYVTDYYAIEHTTNYVPQTYYDPYVDYVPVQRYKERVEYYPVESSRTVINRLP